MTGATSGGAATPSCKPASSGKNKTPLGVTGGATPGGKSNELCLCIEDVSGTTRASVAPSVLPLLLLWSGPPPSGTRSDEVLFEGAGATWFVFAFLILDLVGLCFFKFGTAAKHTHSDIINQSKSNATSAYVHYVVKMITGYKETQRESERVCV